ncbi:hypothetical protein HK100_001082 [Physocladia obscura]|uniref:Uncharacterized protein n=1 Tax=Physocladia obscura TaxID=109957 RepID=A0AAD5XES2_9FUNG|nr:hypothetical protein HK100_001082 [Physocladia obscura]
MSTETKPAVGYEQIGPAFVAKGKANKYVIILGWLDAKFRYLEKYAQQYRERNYTVIVFPSSSADQSVFEHIKVGDALWRDYLGFYSQPRNSHFRYWLRCFRVQTAHLKIGRMKNCVR